MENCFTYKLINYQWMSLFVSYAINIMYMCNGFISGYSSFVYIISSLIHQERSLVIYYFTAYKEMVHATSNRNLVLISIWGFKEFSEM